jgi:hypothetical protein
VEEAGLVYVAIVVGGGVLAIRDRCAETRVDFLGEKGSYESSKPNLGVVGVCREVGGGGVEGEVGRRVAIVGNIFIGIQSEAGSIKDEMSSNSINQSTV